MTLPTPSSLLLVSPSAFGLERRGRRRDLEPAFHLAQLGVAVADVSTGGPSVLPKPTTSLSRGERQHSEIVTAALAGDHRRACDLRREHLVEYPGDGLIVWLPVVLRTGR